MLASVWVAASCSLDTRPATQPVIQRADTQVPDAQVFDAANTGPLTASETDAVIATALDAGGAVLDAATEPDAQVDCGAQDGACAAVECRTALDCKAPETSCRSTICAGGRCTEIERPVGTPCIDIAGNSVVCIEHGVCGECHAGETVCSSETSQRTCDVSGRWSAAISCSLGCFAGRCAECAPGSGQCAANDSRARSCGRNGRWDGATTCQFGCANGRCKACAPGSARCTNDMQELCSDEGSWAAATACGSGGCSGDRCATCVPGAKRCTSAGAQTCGADRQWSAAGACPAGCNGDQCAECANGAVQCPTSTSLRICTEHAWGSVSTCRPDATCNAARTDGNTCPCNSGFLDPHPSPGLCVRLGI